jgi:hypothetical protein
VPDGMSRRAHGAGGARADELLGTRPEGVRS